MNSTDISFDTTKDEFEVISQIVDKAEAIYPDINRMTLVMDISAAHANGCPLKLSELLVAPAYDFNHDIAGIVRHIDRTTGRLEDFFLPRYADVKPDLS